MHHQQAADPLGLAVGRVQDAAAGGELAGVDAEVGELADERVRHDLEGERGERSAVVRRALDRLALGPVLVRDEALDRRHLERGRQQLDDRVEQRLHALVLERRTAEDRA